MILYVRLYSLSVFAILTAQPVNAEAANINFTPTSIKQLSGAIELLKSRSAAMKVAESDFKFDDSVDGVKGRGSSKEENALYASIVFGENKTAVMDGLYYYKRCLLKNNSNSGSYAEGYSTLMKTAEKAFGVTDNEIDEISIRANYDHLIENNVVAKRLITDGREDLVVVVARTRVTRSKEDKNEILNKTKDLVSQVPIPTQTVKDFIKITGLLLDLKLATAITEIVKKAVSNDPSFKDVTIAPSQN